MQETETRTPSGCHSEPFAVILSEAKDLARGAQGRLHEESGSEAFGMQSEIPRRLRLLGMTPTTRGWHDSVTETNDRRMHSEERVLF